MLSLTVPSNRKGSCRMTAILLLNTLKGKVLMSTLSIRMLPRLRFETRSKALIIELFPAPVLPTIPRRS